ncbi:HMCN1-like protein [Mya arenaria]|uniref:HMCN1-like protein n=1 Tax=Mya arenaria TaxID=6604 RepID=A0ABY7G607_MYAAR|nr:HMCN1-like protein [Mya arenaria]
MSCEFLELFRFDANRLTAIGGNGPNGVSATPTVETRVKTTGNEFMEVLLQRELSSKFACGITLFCSGVDGGWGDWSTWSECDANCGKKGMKERRRYCDNPAPEGTGVDCPGDYEEKVECERTCDMSKLVQVKGLPQISISCYC